MKKTIFLLFTLLLFSTLAFPQDPPPVTISGANSQQTVTGTSFGIVPTGTFTLGGASFGTPGDFSFALSQNTSASSFSASSDANGDPVTGTATVYGSTSTYTGGSPTDGTYSGGTWTGTVTSTANGYTGSSGTGSIDCNYTNPTSGANAYGSLTLMTGVQSAQYPQLYGFTSISGSYGASTNSGSGYGNSNGLYATASGSVNGYSSATLNITPNANTSNASTYSVVTATGNTTNP
jgi:hypothetical protein